jgi:hypothetical protein
MQQSGKETRNLLPSLPLSAVFGSSTNLMGRKTLKTTKKTLRADIYNGEKTKKRT